MHCANRIIPPPQRQRFKRGIAHWYYKKQPHSLWMPPCVCSCHRHVHKVVGWSEIATQGSVRPMSCPMLGVLHHGTKKFPRAPCRQVTRQRLKQSNLLQKRLFSEKSGSSYEKLFLGQVTTLVILPLLFKSLSGGKHFDQPHNPLGRRRSSRHHGMIGAEWFLLEGTLKDHQAPPPAPAPPAGGTCHTDSPPGVEKHPNWK